MIDDVNLFAVVPLDVTVVGAEINNALLASTV
jgi:hypothetical protein